MWVKFLKYLKDALFPVRCLNCKKEGDWVCLECFKTINLNGIFEQNHAAITLYQENLLIGKIIRGFKYNYIMELSDIIEKMIKIFIEKNSKYFAEVDCIIPVPLHRKRFAERGFNQSELIAGMIGKIIGKPIKLSLVRERNTEHQARLGREKRLNNVTNAFKNLDIATGKILLVDDVFTTGSTIKECKKVLLAAGAREVISFTLAKGES